MPSQNKIEDPAEMLVEDKPWEGPHPGQFVRHELIEPFNLTVAEAARRLKVDRSGFVGVLDGKYGISRDLAYKLEAMTGVDAELLIRMQLAWDLANERSVRASYLEIIERLDRPEEGGKPKWKRGGAAE